MTDLAATHNTPLNNYLANRSPAWETWADDQADEFVALIDDLAALGASKTTELIGLARENSLAAADVAHARAIDYNGTERKGTGRNGIKLVVGCLVA
jgi:hypothetical protein